MDARRPFIHLAYGLILAVAASLGSPVPVRAAQAAEDAVILVAKPGLRDFLYGASILITKPVGNDQHIGFIVNRPTPVTLGKLFPHHSPSQKVTDPVYLGGPVSPDIIFALVRRPDSPSSHSMQVTPGLYLVLEGDVVDRVIEAEADHARFFAGLVVWAPGELRAELDRGLWYVLDADASLVLRKSTDGMWEELVKRLQQRANAISAGLF